MKRLFLLAAAAAAIGCANGAAERADSLQAVSAQQVQLMNQLSAQKDSLTRVVLDADSFISKVDSTISTVKGLPKSKRKQALESPIQEQLVQRKEMLERVNALVARAKTTAAQLAEARRREQALRGEVDTLKGENAALRAQIEQDQKMIADLGETIQRQTVNIAGLEARIDTLNTEMTTLGKDHFRAYYIVGSEKELLEKGVIVKEGGANLLVKRVGRSLVPARALNPELFTEIDQREVSEIPLPDSTKRYQIVSRQSLDDCEVQDRDKATFRGQLRIADSKKFWSPSRYLIVVQR